MEERTPDGLPDLLALVLPYPVGRGDVFERAEIGSPLEVEGGQHEAGLVDPPHRPELEQGHGSAEIPQPSAGPNAHSGGEPFDELTDAEIFGESDAGFVRGEEVVIKGFERFTVDLEDSGQPSRARVALENLNPVSLFSEP